MKCYKETLHVEKHAFGPDHHDAVLSTGLWLLRLSENKNGGIHIAVTKMLNLIGNIHLQRAEASDFMNCYTEASRIYKRQGQPQETLLVIAGYKFYALSKNHPECAAIA